MLSQEEIAKNFKSYKACLSRAIGPELTDAVIEALGGEGRVMNAPFNDKTRSGCAYAGAFVENAVRIATMASFYNKLILNNGGAKDDKHLITKGVIKVDPNSLAKVALLSHIAKVVSYTLNTDEFEVQKRGIVYKYIDSPAALRFGEKSILIAMNAGVKFTEEEFEAMRIMDKTTDDTFIKFFSSPLSVIIRQANEIVQLENETK